MTEPQDSTTLQAEHPDEYAGGARDALIETPPVPYDDALGRCAARIDAGMADSAAYWLGYARQVQASENARTGADDAHLAHARYLGADAALSSNSWIEMSESDARSILDDVDPEVMDRYEGPNLSGEWADSPTPQTLASDILSDEEATSDDAADLIDALADAWEQGRNAVWGDALQATALRVLGEVDNALRVEAGLEAIVASYRKAAGL